MIVVAGFDGNTDSVFVMLVLLAVYLLQLRGRPFGAGFAFGIAISLKLTPVVVLPWLLFLAVRQGRGTLVRFVGAGALVFLVLWVPVLLLRFEEFRDAALGYRGVALREWGFSYFITSEGPTWAPVAEWFSTTGSNLAVLVAMLSPFVFVAWQRGRANLLALSGFPLATFLLITPAYGMQYLDLGTCGGVPDQPQAGDALQPGCQHLRPDGLLDLEPGAALALGRRLRGGVHGAGAAADGLTWTFLFAVVSGGPAAAGPGPRRRARRQRANRSVTSGLRLLTRE